MKKDKKDSKKKKEIRSEEVISQTGVLQEEDINPEEMETIETEKPEAESAEEKESEAGTANEEEPKNPRVKIGIRSAILVVAVLAFGVLLNVLLERLQISWDLSQEKIYTISDQSKSIVNGLEQDITIYVLDSQEGFPIGYQQILKQYEKENRHIQIAYRDLTLYPSFPYEYVDTSTEVNPDSLIVVCGDEGIYLDAEEYYKTEARTDGTYTAVLEFEPLITAAINTLNDGETSVIYQTTGHNELSLPATIQTGILRDNFSLEDLQLLNLDEIPEDADIVLIHAPTTDFSKEDCDKLRKYLDQGGSIYYIMEPAAALSNLEDLMADYGITVADGIVMEQNINMIYGGSSDSATPTYLLPNVLDTEITHDMYEARMAVLIPISKGLLLKEKSGYAVTGILETSDYAFSKVDVYSESVSREDEDIVGPFYLSAVSKKENGGSIFVLASSNVLADEVNEITTGNNGDFFINGLDYLVGDTDKISIRGKEISDGGNVFSSREVTVISGIAIIGLPVLIIVCGVMIVLRRRKRSQTMQRRKEDNIRPALEEAMKEEKETENRQEEIQEDTETNETDV